MQSRRPEAYQVVVFDLDGTLVDSRDDIANAANELLVECGAVPLDGSRIGRMVGDGAAVLVARAFDASGIPAPPEALGRFLEIYGQHLLDRTVAYAGVPEVLDALRARSTLAVLSNKPLEATRRILRGLDLSRYFDESLVIGGDGPWPRKPAPNGLLHLISTARVDPSRALLVGDSLVDWRTARAASTSICMARYGFGYEGFPTASLGPEDLVIDEPRHLLEL